MKEDQNHIDYLELISKYLSANASDAEVEQLEQWVLASPANKKQFAQLKKAWQLSRLRGNPQQIDVDEEWRVTSEQLFRETPVISIEKAAEKTSRSRVFYLPMAAAAMALCLLALWWLLPQGQTASGLALNTLDQIAEQQLSDGSQVALNQYSSITFAPSDSIRRLDLTGDAFFEVKRDTLRPFIISASDIEVEVLGTSFYIDARKEVDDTEVVVKSGRVAVRAKGQSIILQANETGIYRKQTGELIRQSTEDANYLAWKSDTLVFEKANLEEVVFALNRKFHARISLGNADLKTCKFTGVFDNQSLEVILQILEKSFNIKARKSGDQIIFEGKACD